MTRIVLALIFTATSALAFSPVLPADVLLIDEVRQAGQMELPENGLSKADVKARFGEPRQTKSAVGDPPISSWEYDRWSVYFEYDLVLFTVLHKGQVLDKQSG
jgi:hypothetical protein